MKKKMKLKPCPFCGGTTTERQLSVPLIVCWIRCKKCRASTRGFATMRAATLAWNRRSKPLAVGDMADRKNILKEQGI